MDLTTQLGASDDIEVPDAAIDFNREVIEDDQSSSWDTESNTTDLMDDGELSSWSVEDGLDTIEVGVYEEDYEHVPAPDLSKIQPVKAHIPFEIWLEIFSVSEPRWLGRTRRVSKTFKMLIDNNDVWKRARRCHHPNYSNPMFGLTEMQMWSFRWGRDCTTCGTRTGKISIHWQFHARLCLGCSRKYLIHVCTHSLAHCSYGKNEDLIFGCLG